MGMDISPDTYVLNSVEWQAFGSLTFRAERNAKMSIPLFLRVNRRAEALWGCKGDSWWVLREEQGEAFGRNHVHFLVGGFPAKFFSVEKGVTRMEFFSSTGCLWWVHEWTVMVRGGWARVRPINELCETANEYIAKGRSNRYEMDKFNDIHFSRKLVQLIGRQNASVNSLP